VKIGFTGSQHGLTSPQRAELKVLLDRLKPELVVHGACIGADDWFDQLAAKLRIPRLVFPGNVPAKRVHDDELIHRSATVEIRAPKPMLNRNKDIVRNSDLLIACPRQAHEVIRSGTWATVRFALHTNVEVYMVWP
jgi:hypothetical protein